MNEIMCYRRVSKKWRETIKKVAPVGDFRVNNLSKYNGMRVMTRALPNLQQIRIGYLGRFHKYGDGEDPTVEKTDRSVLDTAHDIGIISNFRKLRELRIFDAGLNGRYPSLFNFPLLQKLSITGCRYLKWDLEMLAGMPVLKELECDKNHHLDGNISSFRVLKDTLEKVNIFGCENVEGNFMDLADFPHLKVLYLDRSAVTGDIRDIGENDFSSLEELILPKSVYGGNGHELQRISDAPKLVRAVYLLSKQRPTLSMLKYWRGYLSRDSPDWYESAFFEDERRLSPPFDIGFVQAASRVGYRWETLVPNGNCCEVNWLDPEPDRESSDYAECIEELQKLERRVNFYRGFHQPPTAEEFRRLIEDYNDNDQNVQRPPLRFEVGQRVACRVGRDPVNGWAMGRIIQLWYRERAWAANAWAAYKIELDNGRWIYAPNDVDEVIRAAS
jgi:hypothetical protein